MSNCCNIPNPLIRDGVSQRQRQVAALRPDYVKVDDRTLADFLVFAFRFAHQLHYYDAQDPPSDRNSDSSALTINRIVGDWRALFTRSTPVWIALISKTPWRSLNQTYKDQLQKQLITLQRQVSDPNRDALTLQNLRPILLTWAELLSYIRLWYEALENYTPLKSIIRGLVKTNLATPVGRMQAFDLAYTAAAEAPAVPINFYQTLTKKFGVERPPEDDFYSGFAKAFGLNLGPAVADPTPIGNSSTRAEAELNEVFQVLFQNFHQIVEVAPQYQIHSLSARRDHRPHIAMFISFWEVLKPARQDLNRMTQRHLDFFYRQVLQLPERPPEADHVHLLFELAKFQQEFALKADIRFKAGKDATGAELFYTLDRDIVINKAQVASLQAIFLDSTERRAPGGKPPETITGLYASPVANSFDGSGGEFSKDQAVKAWSPFVSHNCQGDRPCNPADIGIAIADPILLLQEGTRKITFQFTLESLDSINNATATKLRNAFRVLLSGEKAWLPAKGATASIGNNQVTLTIELPPDTEAIVPFHADLEEPTLQLKTQHPVALIYLTSEALENGRVPYHFFQAATLNGITITVEVDEVRNLVLQNDLSVLDPTKPFQLFGPLPKVGSNFYIGSQEVFQKALTQLQFFIDFETDRPEQGWAEYYASYDAIAQYALEDYDLVLQSINNPGEIQETGERVIVVAKIANEASEDSYFHIRIFDQFSNRVIDAGRGEFLPKDDLVDQLNLKFDELEESDAEDDEELSRDQLEAQQQAKRELINQIEADLGIVPIPNLGDVNIQALRGSKWRPSSNTPDTIANIFDLSAVELNGLLPDLSLDQAESTEAVDVWNHGTKNGFLRLQLIRDDFFHDEYAKVLSRQILAQAMASMPDAKAILGAYYWVDGRAEKSNSTEFAPPNPGNDPPRQPNIPRGSEVVISNEPFTPVVQSLYLSYIAATTINLAEKNAGEESTSQDDFRVFHLHPFDRYASLDTASSPHFLPHFDQEGELFIGLENLQPLTVLNLLFQLAEETADTTLETAEVTWSYLIENRWVRLEDYQIINDGTNELIDSGVVQLAIPADISKQHTTILDPAFYWLKVSVPERAGAIPQIIGIHAQAARATFTDEDNDPNHLATPLPAGTIAKLVGPLPDIKKIEQPYQSFGGRPPEKPQNYYIRISEHLRHKGRAVTIFDYERIVLEHFPEIYKVRCINHGQVVSDRLRELMPGFTTLAVIPDLSQRRTTNDLQPKVNINLLKRIQEDLHQYCSPWVELQIVNPRYEEIQVEFEVKFHPPYDSNFDFYRRELENEIVGFLSPWTVSEGAEIHFGGKVYRSAILNFVEEHPTVDYVLNFKMNQGIEKDIREFVAPTARSILVSVVPSTAMPAGPGHLITQATSCPDSLAIASDALAALPLSEITLSNSNS